MDKLDEVFCDVVDFCKVSLPEWEKLLLINGTRKRKRSGRMSISEVMTIVICFHMSHHRDFKNYYIGYIARFYKGDFPRLLSYTRFLEVMPNALMPLSSYFKTLRGKPTGIEFIDSTCIKVCHNLRIPQHKTFDGIAQRGKGTMCIFWPIGITYSGSTGSLIPVDWDHPFRFHRDHF
jgi:hypothetical protein